MVIAPAGALLKEDRRSPVSHSFKDLPDKAYVEEFEPKIVIFTAKRPGRAKLECKLVEYGTMPKSEG